MTAPPPPSHGGTGLTLGGGITRLGGITATTQPPSVGWCTPCTSRPWGGLGLLRSPADNVEHPFPATPHRVLGGHRYAQDPHLPGRLLALVKNKVVKPR